MATIVTGVQRDLTFPGPLEKVMEQGKLAGARLSGSVTPVPSCPCGQFHQCLVLIDNDLS